MAGNNITVGFVGLGIMGGPMAMNILKAGFDVKVHNRSAEKADPLRQAGARAVCSAVEAATDSDIVITCLPNTPDVLDVVLDDGKGIVAGVKKGAIVMDCSTVSPDAAVKCTSILKTKEAAFLDAPVSGGDVGAQNGTLSIMVGGQKKDFDRALPILKAMGKTITYCGPSGAGYIVKICNQILTSMHVLAASEALSLAVSAGIDPQAMLKAVSSGAADSWMVSNMAPKMLEGDFDPGFFLDYQLKDLRLAHEAADALNTPLPGAALAETMFRSASAMGLGREGSHALYKAVRALQGLPPGTENSET